MKYVTHSQIDHVGKTLSLLSTKLLEELSSQCKFEIEKNGGYRKNLINGILTYIESAKGPAPVLRTKTKPISINSLERGKRYLLGGINSSIFIATKHNHAGHESYFLDLDPSINNVIVHLFSPFPFDFDIECIWSTREGLFYQTILEDIIIPNDTEIITDVQAIDIKGQLQIGRNSKLLGLHPCGLNITANSYSGHNVDRCGSFAPTISTSARPQSFEVAQPFHPGYPYLREINGTLESIHGSDNETRIRTQESLSGDMGRRGYCTWTREVVYAGDGGESGNGKAGEAGGCGEEGLSPKPLSVNFVGFAQGKLRLDTNAGNGGQGGKGGAGQGVNGGKGGDYSRGCADLLLLGGTPGHGGNGGKAGGGGAGGQGGRGGNAGSISLKYPNGSDLSYLASAKGGEGGQGAYGGDGGSSRGGLGGNWLDYFSDDPDDVVDGPGDGQRNGRAGASGDHGETGANGLRGWNGRIVINRQVHVAPNNELERNDYEYPTCPLSP